jgi:hypothetical protein
MKHAKHILLRKRAEDEASTGVVQGVVPKAATQYLEDHRSDIQVSDKEFPESFSDLRPLPRSTIAIDPSYLLVPASMSGSRLDADAVKIANQKAFLSRFGEGGGIFKLTGSHGSFAVAIRVSAISAEMLKVLKGLDDYASMDDEETSKQEHEQVDEAWSDWAMEEYTTHVVDNLPEWEDRVYDMDDDQKRVLFERVRERLKMGWEPDSTGMYIDTARLALNTSTDDLEAVLGEVVK